MDTQTAGADGGPGGIRIVLDWVEITDSMDVDSVGEFRFLFRVRSDLRGLLKDTPLPEEGTVSISEEITKNHLGPLELVLYDGPVEPGEALTLEVTGEEVDLLSSNDALDWYERTFTGDPASWIGAYTPWDEGGHREDPENRAQWRMSYRIEASAAEAAAPAGALAPDAARRSI